MRDVRVRGGDRRAYDEDEASVMIVSLVVERESVGGWREREAPWDGSSEEARSDDADKTPPNHVPHLQNVIMN